MRTPRRRRPRLRREDDAVGGEVLTVRALADIEAAREVLERRRGRARRWRSRAGSPSWSAARCGSRPRTSSAPARSRSAAPTCGSPGSPPRSGPAAWSCLGRQPRPGRGPRRASARHLGHRVHARGRADPQGARHPRLRRRRGLLQGTTSRRRWSRPTARRAATGAVLIHPFDHADVMAGQGTLGLEVLEQLPDVPPCWCPPAGAGCWPGSPLAVKGLRPDVQGRGVQAADAAAYPGSLASGVAVASRR